MFISIYVYMRTHGLIYVFTRAYFVCMCLSNFPPVRPYTCAPLRHHTRSHSSLPESLPSAADAAA